LWAQHYRAARAFAVNPARLTARPLWGFGDLPDLTDQDLKEIGVSLGYRRQLLREIAKLGKTASLVSAYAIGEKAACDSGE